MKTDRLKIEFTEELILPRFSVKKGETWEVRKEKITQQGFPVGGGFCKSGQYRAA